MGKVQTPYDELTYRIIGMAMSVHNELGPGLSEEMYKRAITILMDSDAVGYDREFSVPVEFRGKSIGSLRLDLLVERQIILELKAVTTLAPVHEQQALTYLAASGLEVALLINFGAPRLEYKRLFPSKAVQSSHAYTTRQSRLKSQQSIIR